MAINLVTYAAQTVTPQDDALIYENALIGSGMIYGGEVTIKSANVLHVAAGHGALCGRKFTIEATDIPISLTPSGSLLGRVYIHMDLSDTDEPISFMTETANNLTPVIQDNDVNINNGVYEINLATFDVSTSSISNLVNCAPYAKKVLIGTLNAGATSVTFTDSSILESSDYEIKTEVYGVVPNTVTITQGQAVLDFDPQANNMGVKLIVAN
jgi:hypothetical protein